MKIKLDPWGTLPTMGHPESDAGWDLYSPGNYCIPAGAAVKIDIGVHVQLPRAVGGFITGRSSMVSKGIMTSGLIDPGYTGEIGVTLINASSEEYMVLKGDRIAQLVIVPVMRSSWELVGELAPSKRGDGGFGSTGR